MPGAELSLLVDAAEASGKIALKHFRHDPRIWNKPDGLGPVTAADLEVDAMLRHSLRKARPDYGWLSEETPDTNERLSAKRVFVVDPIDGTRAFIAGEKSWAHSLAVVENGRPIVGVVHLPMLDRTYAAVAGGGAFLNGTHIIASARTELDGAKVLATAALLEESHWPGGVPRFERHFRPSLAYRLCLVAEGRFDAMMSFRATWEWDVAAGDLIASEAGAVVTTGAGEVPAYNNSTPLLAGLLAAGPGLHPGILERVRPSPAPAPSDQAYDRSPPAPGS